MLFRDSDGSSAITGSQLPHSAPGPANLGLHPGPVALLGGAAWATLQHCMHTSAWHSCLIQGVSLSLCRQPGRQTQPGADSSSGTFLDMVLLVVIVIVVSILLLLYVIVIVVYIYDIVFSPLYSDNKVVR